MKTFTLNISDTAHEALKARADREGSTMADLVRPAIEDAAYAALLSGYTREGLTGYATDADITAHMADVDAIRGGL